MTDDERNHDSNLIYLCPSCHTKIDKQEADFSAESLIQLKNEHEQWIEEQLDNGMSEVTLAELEIASKSIANGQHTENGDLSVLPPIEKISTNALGNVS